MKRPILKENINCSSIKKIKRLGVLIDSHEYYQAFFDVVQRAKTSVDILGWEFESEINLDRIARGFPQNLRTFFKTLVTENPYLKVNIQTWRSPQYLLFGRERFADLKWKIETPDRVDFHNISHPSVYGSYHEKLAVIDNSCAFLGGMDISRRRWDTSLHDLKNPLRRDAHGFPYFPIHDVQVVCSGEILHELNRYMHLRNPVTSPVAKKDDLWPHVPMNDIENVEGACSRTSQEGKTYEIENLYLDAIRAAQDFIYIENQYFSHKGIVRALCRRLEEENGPEVVIILPRGYRGIFEKAVYIPEREKAFRELRRADRFKRLRIYYPNHRVSDPSVFIVVHSKLMIVDNTFITIGSANLNHRSMRVDNELNLSFEARDGRTHHFISQIFYRLLAEHLDTSMTDLKEIFESQGIGKTIQYFKDRNERTLTDIPETKLKPLEKMLRISTPMVDVHYPIPKNNVFILIFMMILMGLIFMQDYIE